METQANSVQTTSWVDVIIFERQPSVVASAASTGSLISVSAVMSNSNVWLSSLLRQELTYLSFLGQCPYTNGQRSLPTDFPFF